MQNDGAVAQKPRPFTMNGMPLSFQCTTLMLNSYSVTTVKEIHKKDFFMVLKDSIHYLLYWWYCFEFICWRKWLVFPCYGSFTGFKCLMINPCFFPCNDPLQKLIFLMSSTCQVHDIELYMMCFLVVCWVLYMVRTCFTDEAKVTKTCQYEHYVLHRGKTSVSV
jgi:hypothetical protein